MDGELWGLVFGNLSVCQLVQCRLVSSLWKGWADAEPVWQAYTTLMFPGSEPTASQSWRQLFTTLYAWQWVPNQGVVMLADNNHRVYVPENMVRRPAMGYHAAYSLHSIVPRDGQVLCVRLVINEPNIGLGIGTKDVLDDARFIEENFGIGW
eukprot:TRINITY_DN5507_c1_g1_i1.p1 TRINITY_DN5507_c1_g1~~TRINITY_DN5507_c1_g1_i1.p1  ORF type:complete len:152 (-),score=8.03 TRINITY_DN5507_c1_g1_i1:111-566(-)